MVELKGKNINSAKGITLVALVVTIIILLILASVSITTIFGDNGIIRKAQIAKMKQKLIILEKL